MADQTGNVPLPPAGWYPDPQYPSQMRFWDGRFWAPSQAQLPVQRAVSPRGGQGRTAASAKFWSHPVTVIVALVVFFPVGLVLMWHAGVWSQRARWAVTACVAVLAVIIGLQPKPAPAPVAALGNFPSASRSLTPTAAPATVATPNLVGSTQASVAAILSADGLSLGSITVEHDASPAGTVLAQTPAMGSQVVAGTIVTLVVSSGPLPAPVPTPKLLVVPTPTPKATPTHAASPKPKPTPKPVALTCTASMSNAHPTQYSTTYVQVRTAAGAAVSATAYYKSTNTSHSTKANGSGQASIAFRISGATHGFTVYVDVSVSQGGRTGSCSTSFTTV